MHVTVKTEPGLILMKIIANLKVKCILNILKRDFIRYSNIIDRLRIYF